LRENKNGTFLPIVCNLLPLFGILLHTFFALSGHPLWQLKAIDLNNQLISVHPLMGGF
jgi:hypothetical protein